MVTKKARLLKMRIVLAVVNRRETGTSAISVKEARMVIDELASYGKFVLADIEVKDDKTRIYIELK